MIRSGDNLFSIANYFGVNAGDGQGHEPLDENGLTIGRGLRIPPPTR